MSCFSPWTECCEGKTVISRNRAGATRAQNQINRVNQSTPPPAWTFPVNNLVPPSPAEKAQSPGLQCSEHGARSRQRMCELAHVRIFLGSGNSCPRCASFFALRRGRALGGGVTTGRKRNNFLRRVDAQIGSVILFLYRRTAIPLRCGSAGEGRNIATGAIQAHRLQGGLHG